MDEKKITQEELNLPDIQNIIRKLTSIGPNHTVAQKIELIQDLEMGNPRLKDDMGIEAYLMYESLLMKLRRYLRNDIKRKTYEKVMVESMGFNSFPGFREGALVKNFSSECKQWIQFQCRLLNDKGYLENLQPANFKDLKNGRVLVKISESWKKLGQPLISEGYPDLQAEVREGRVLLLLRDKEVTHPNSYNRQYTFSMSDHKGSFDTIYNGELVYLFSMSFKQQRLITIQGEKLHLTPSWTLSSGVTGYKPYWLPDEDSYSKYLEEMDEVISPLAAQLLGSSYDDPLRPIEILQLTNKINYLTESIEIKYFGDLYSRNRSEKLPILKPNVVMGFGLPTKPMNFINWDGNPLIIGGKK